MKELPALVTLIVGLILLACLASVFAPQTKAPSELVLLSSNNISEVRADFEKNIQQHNPVEVYAELKKTYQNVSFDTQHNAAHIFGESLYKVLGLSGIKVCDTDLNFGCYHGFFRDAVVDRGLEVLEKLGAECASAGVRTSACQHGIGHGILEYLGRSHLSQALEACERTTQSNPIVGCTTGVFMEYNVPLVTSEVGYSVQARSFVDSEGPFAPCNSIAGKFQPLCFESLAQWWKQIFGDDFEKMGLYCASLEEGENRYNCFWGIGAVVAPTSDYSVDRTVSLCSGMPNEETRELCTLSAATVFVANVQKSDEGEQLCSSLASDMRAECVKQIHSYE